MLPACLALLSCCSYAMPSCVLLCAVHSFTQHLLGPCHVSRLGVGSTGVTQMQPLPRSSLCPGAVLYFLCPGAQWGSDPPALPVPYLSCSPSLAT